MLSKNTRFMSKGYMNQLEGTFTDNLRIKRNNDCNGLKHKYIKIYEFIIILKSKNLTDAL